MLVITFPWTLENLTDRFESLPLPEFLRYSIFREHELMTEYNDGGELFEETRPPLIGLSRNAIAETGDRRSGLSNFNVRNDVKRKYAG